MSKGAQIGTGSVSRTRSSAWTAISAPACAATAALSPIWSQWPWVDTISLSVQSRAASSSAIQARLGVAVSMAIASRVRASARTWTLVATGPTTRWRVSMRALSVTRLGRHGLQLGAHAVERLADHLLGRALDQPCADARQRADQVDVGGPVHRGHAGQAVR